MHSMLERHQVWTLYQTGQYSQRSGDGGQAHSIGVDAPRGATLRIITEAGQ